MLLKIEFPRYAEHSDIVSCVAWNNTEEVLSCGDDHLLMKWNLITGDSQKVCELPNEVFPLDFHSFSRNIGGRKQTQEQLLITSSDGRFHLIGKSGRIEKSVDAHKGAVLVGQWSPDGSSLLTGGEDGNLKIWSRSGMLRSLAVQGTGVPVYSAFWGSDSTQVLYTQGKHLVIKPLTPNSKSNRWKAHDGLILKVAWDHVNGRIISGGEDCRYKVWDMYGTPIFSSLLHEHSITSLAWSPSGDLFAVGSFNTIRLCDKSGWSHCLEKPATGSLYCIAWSTDGTQLAAGCANHKLLLAHIIGRKVEWGQFEGLTTGRKTVVVHDVLSDGSDALEFSERVIHLALAFKHLVVVTTTQAYIYSTSNFNTPIIIDLREGSVSNVLLSDKHLVLVERTSLSVYNFEGRLLSSPRWASLNTSTLNPCHITLGPDTIAARDQADERLIQVLDISGKDIGGPIQHNCGVMEVGISQGGKTSIDILLAFVDKTRDLFISTVYTRSTASRRIEKLGSIVQSFKWNSALNIIAAMQDSSLILWYLPYILFVDKRMTKKTAVIKDASEFGHRPRLISFVDNYIGIQRSDGAIINSGISPYIGLLHGYASTNAWKEALRLCRMVQDEALWSCLAIMATQAKDIETAETAYAAINFYDKVLYIQHIKQNPIKAVRMAEMSLLGGNIQEAEMILLQNGMIFRAIMSNINTHNWERALEIAVRHKTHIDTVLYYREKFMERLEKPETNEKFKELRANVDIIADQVEKKVAKEYEMEKEKS
ncbi:intraflagellar transport protein 80 homolog isoform X1 [Halyomorpha halys]|uniref:intraflagellar transport protein 80 homolog isoform X1 n=2 Tax=Halyomorpha halys TaxID=286706 RepID=UPI0006D4D7D7|nr:intraflagellar transport protein 80 homolog isoform X1 [Halyomorpha halys]